MLKIFLLSTVTIFVAASAVTAGKHRSYITGPTPPPLGSQHDMIMQTQEENAEAAKYVIYMHEFELNRYSSTEGNLGGWKLNEYGEDHVQQIAVNVKRGDQFPIVIERSQTSVKPGTMYEYPIHFNDMLDAQRRRIVVSALTALGVADADYRVIVAPAAAEGYTAAEAARAYTIGLRGRSGGGGGYGSGFGGSFGGGFGR